MPQDLGPKKTTLKRGDLKVRTRSDFTTILWRDKRDVRILTNIHDAPAESNFCDTKGKALKPQIVRDYNHHMCYVDKEERMAITISPIYPSYLFYQPSHMEVDKETLLPTV
jgi:hypothetical protein